MPNGCEATGFDEAEAADVDAVGGGGSAGELSGDFSDGRMLVELLCAGALITGFDMLLVSSFRPVSPARSTSSSFFLSSASVVSLRFRPGGGSRATRAAGGGIIVEAGSDSGSDTVDDVVPILTGASCRLTSSRTSSIRAVACRALRLRGLGECRERERERRLGEFCGRSDEVPRRLPDCDRERERERER